MLQIRFHAEKRTADKAVWSPATLLILLRFPCTKPVAIVQEYMQNFAGFPVWRMLILKMFFQIIS